MKDKKIVYFTRRERFSSAHMLNNPDWDAKKNHEVFGKCAHENWHGHNYVLFVTVKGEPDPETGMTVDLVDLKRIIKDKIIDKVDHKNLTLDVDFLKDKISTTEILVIGIWEELEAAVLGIGAELHCVKVVETENNIAEYYG